MSERFHVNSKLSPGPFELEGPEAHHLSVVRRLRPGDRVCLFNGDGCEYPAVIEEVHRRSVDLRIESAVERSHELPFHLEVASALPKGDRAQVMIEKLTELGVTRFVPLRTVRGVVQPRESRGDRLERYVIEASKQCGRNTLMAVAEPCEWRDYCQSNLPSRRLVAHPGGLALTAGGLDDVVLAIGPEGGFTDEEVQLAGEAGWMLVSLGSRILRVETAALSLASWFSLGRG